MKKSQEKFNILHIDPLGQGVSKSEDEIFFVHNTLEGENGIADVDGQKKGILFGHLKSEDELISKSEKRITPECPHFFSCNGCHYLHTTYENEINIKLDSIKRSISLYERKTNKIFNHEKLFSHAADERFFSRNRIQLHYDLSKKKMGLIGHKKNQLIEIPHCLLASKEISKQIKILYQNNHWISLIPKGSNKQGHLEIKFNNNEIDLIFNHPYSHGGFTQVNEKMNEILKSIIKNSAEENFQDSDIIFDLFGGSGNLSKNLKKKPCIVIDSYAEGMLVDRDGHQEFKKQNLYANDAPEIIFKMLKKYNRPGIILDPPRSGLKNINDFFGKADNIDKIIYVSCNPATLFRDIAELKNFSLEELHLVDLFPCTYHFETVCILKKDG